MTRLRWRAPLLLALGLAACTTTTSLPGTGQAGTLAPAVAGPTTSSPTTAATAPQPASWTPCGSGLQCASVSVPLDYTHPAGRHLSIALERRPASGLRVGSLLLNPGGPGESGISSMSLFESILSPTLLDRFDLVTFDPRGVGRSAGVHCLDGPAMDAYLHADPAPPTPAALAAVVTADRTLAAACAARNGDLLDFVGTVNAARDMDAIRQALGEPKLTYLGFSYGTLLGATYADLFPDRVRAMVLDGAVDPSLDAVTTDDQQALGFDRELGDFFADCLRTPTCAWKPGPDPKAAFDALLAGIRAHPLAVGARSVGPAEAFLGVVAPLYDRANWPLLAAALERAGHGDGAPLLQLFDSYVERQSDGSYTGSIEANLAITCADQQWPTDPAAYPPLAAAAARLAPEFGAENVYSSLECAVWPVHPAGPPRALHAKGSPSIVVVGSTNDPATPYPWAQALAGQLQHGVLVTRQGEGHVGYEFSSCVRAAVDGYLVDGTVPAAGTTCASDS